MRGVQYSDFVEVFNCLTALESNMLVVMIVRTVLKVPFEKAAPHCPSDVLTPLVIVNLKIKIKFWAIKERVERQ